jgi:hypothetical protein
VTPARAGQDEAIFGNVSDAGRQGQYEAARTRVKGSSKVNGVFLTSFAIRLD